MATPASHAYSNLGTHVVEPTCPRNSSSLSGWPRSGTYGGACAWAIAGLARVLAISGLRVRRRSRFASDHPRPVQHLVRDSRGPAGRRPPGAAARITHRPSSTRRRRLDCPPPSILQTGRWGAPRRDRIDRALDLPAPGLYRRVAGPPGGATPCGRRGRMAPPTGFAFVVRGTRPLPRPSHAP